MPLQDQEQRLAPKLKQKSIYTIPDGMRGFLGASLLQETVIENQKTRQKHRIVEHDFYEKELPNAVAREREIAATAVMHKVRIMNQFRSDAGEKDDQTMTNNNIQNTSPLPTLAATNDDDDASLLFRSASPIEMVASNKKNASVSGKSKMSSVSSMKNNNSKQQQQQQRSSYSPSCSSPPRHLHQSHSFPRLSPFVTTSSSNKETGEKQRKLQAVAEDSSTSANKKTANNTINNDKQQQRRNSGGSQASLLSSSSGLKKKTSSAASLVSYEAAGIAKGASNALVKQLELLRLRTPTPTLVDDVANAFQVYDGSRGMKTNNKVSSQQPQDRHQSVVGEKNDSSSFQFTKCTVVNQSALVGESIHEHRCHHQHQTNNNNNNNKEGDLSTVSSSSAGSFNNNNHQSRSRSRQQQQQSFSPVFSSNDNAMMTSNLQESSSVYTTQDQKLDAIEENGELCGRLRTDISSIPRRRNLNDGNTNNESSHQQQRPSSVLSYSSSTSVPSSSHRPLSSLFGGNGFGQYQNGFGELRQMPLKFVQF